MPAWAVHADVGREGSRSNPASKVIGLHGNGAACTAYHTVLSVTERSSASATVWIMYDITNGH